MLGYGRISEDRRAFLVRAAVVAAFVVVIGGASNLDVASPPLTFPAPATELFESATAVMVDEPMGVPLLHAWVAGRRPANPYPDVPITQSSLVEALEGGQLATASYLVQSIYGSEVPQELLPGMQFEAQWAVAPTVEELLLDTVRPAPADAPPIPLDSGEGRRIVYSNSEQRLWIIGDSGRLLDSYLISGKKGEPASGTYQIYSKSPKARAFYGGITMNWMVRFAYGVKNGISIGFHDMPLYPTGVPMQTLDELGSYRSSGCVRQPNGKAYWLYNWAEIGDTVVMVP